MKIYCCKTAHQKWAEKDARLTQWHDHFAWLPVWVDDEGCRWLETVSRKAESSNFGNEYHGEFEYKAKPTGERK